MSRFSLNNKSQGIVTVKLIGGSVKKKKLNLVRTLMNNINYAPIRVFPLNPAGKLSWCNLCLPAKFNGNI